MSAAELRKLAGNPILICCFGGIGMKMGGILPFEFLNYLSTNYETSCDLLFFIDKQQCCYHKGIEGITTDIESTVKYIDEIICQGKYKKVILMGVSAGGYASILFGSLCQQVTNVISFIPKTMLTSPHDPNYKCLKPFINSHTNYILLGDTNVFNRTDNHHISQCEDLEGFSNVTVIRKKGVNLKKMRDDGTIKALLDNALKTA